MKTEYTTQTAQQHFGNGLYCAESVVLAVTQAHGIESELLPKMATAFCSGMARTCGPCGALTGAVMGISAVLGRSNADDSVQDTYRATALLVDRFEQTFGSRNCHELLGCDLGTAEGQTQFREQQLHEHCRRYTTQAAAFAEEILQHTNTPHIEPASDMNAVRSLLLECQLPVDDIDTNPRIECYGIHQGQTLVGLVGLEISADVALLRSLAVTPSARQHGLGKALVAFAESTAAAKGVRQIYLLTTTAGHFFEHLGYTLTHRDTAPQAIKQTPQFSGICPASAVFMSKQLGG